MRATLVCLNYPPEPTGIAVYSGGLAEGLAELGWEVTVVTGLPHYPQWKVYEEYAKGGVEETTGRRVDRRRHVVPAQPRMINRLLMELTFGISAVAARWHRPEVVVMISPALFSSAFAAVRAKLTRRPYVVWVQDIYSLGVFETGAAGGVAGHALAFVEKTLLRHATQVVAIHERFKSYLVRELGLDPDHVTVVRNWSHIDVAEHADRATLRARLDWPDDVTVVLHAGNMGAKQGLMNVVEASRVAAARGENLLFVLMGDGNRRAELEAAEGNACLRIVDPLPRDEFLDALKAADVLLVNELAGLSEMAVPSKLTSYFATGRPVIAATDAASVTAQEIALAGAGIRVDAEAPEQLVDAALKLRDDPALSAELGARGIAFRESTLTAEAAFGRFDELLSAAARRSGGRSDGRVAQPIAAARADGGGPS